MMLLQIVPDSGHVGDCLSSGSQTNADALPVGRVRFLRLLDKCFEHYAFNERSTLGGALLLSDLPLRPALVQVFEVVRQRRLKRRYNGHLAAAGGGIRRQSDRSPESREAG